MVSYETASPSILFELAHPQVKLVVFASSKIKAKVIPVLKQAGVIRSLLFGSVARGEATAESDIDILVEFPRGKNLPDLIGLEMELERVLGKKVDLVTFKSINPLLKDYIYKDRQPIF